MTTNTARDADLAAADAAHRDAVWDAAAARRAAEIDNRDDYEANLAADLTALHNAQNGN